MDAISEQRSTVIEKSINLESLVSAIICQHYFGRVNSFMFEVLYDESFTFGLKLRILEKVAPQLERKVLEQIRKLNSIRNTFAHCNQLVVKGPNPLDESAARGVPNPRKIEGFVDFGAIYTEFVDNIGSIEKVLVKVYEEKGGTFFQDDESK